jgi:hypothetical protein
VLSRVMSDPHWRRVEWDRETVLIFGSGLHTLATIRAIMPSVSQSIEERDEVGLFTWRDYAAGPGAPFVDTLISREETLSPGKPGSETDIA